MTQAQAAIRLVLLTAIFPLFLFPCAGRWDWPMAWALMAVLILATLVSRWMAFKEHPDLLDERATSMHAENTKPWDKVLSPLMGIVPLLLLVVGGLDERYHWSPPVSVSLQLIGVLLAILGYVLATWAMLANKFFSGVVRIQTERGHSVVSHGPYAIVRHPGYSGMLIATFGFPLALSSYWAFVPAVLALLITIARTHLEDRTLVDELPGYAEFTTRTRFRLMPGIW